MCWFRVHSRAATWSVTWQVVYTAAAMSAFGGLVTPGVSHTNPLFLLPPLPINPGVVVSLVVGGVGRLGRWCLDAGARKNKWVLKSNGLISFHSSDYNAFKLLREEFSNLPLPYCGWSIQSGFCGNWVFMIFYYVFFWGIIGGCFSGQAPGFSSRRAVLGEFHCTHQLQSNHRSGLHTCVWRGLSR